MATNIEPGLGRRPSYFRYEAVDRNGRRVKGTLKAASEISAQGTLVERGYTSFDLEPIPSPFSLEAQLPGLFKVKLVEIVTFSRQLSTLLESGVTLLPAIQLLAQQPTSGRSFRRILGHIASDLSTGSSLSQALARHRQAFTEVYRRTIEVGERTGHLEQVLKELASHIEKQAVFARKIRGAMTYPVILLVVGVMVTFILLTVVLPPLADMFEGLGTDLPIPTRIMIFASDFLTEHPLPLLVLFVILASGLAYFLKQPKGQRTKDWLSFYMPVVGQAVLLAELARICRTLSLMLGAGLPLQDTMDILPTTTSNSLLKSGLWEMRERLYLGEGLAYPMAANPLFPPLMLQMVRVGEESNSLPFTMGVVADFYEDVATERTEAMVAMITPLSTILMALGVGFIALSVILPVYSLTGSF